MDTQFWWFYDVAALAIAAILIYSSTRKGFSKSIVLAVGCVFSTVAAMFACNPVADFVYENAVRTSNISSIERSLNDFHIAEKYKMYMDGLDYNINVKTERLNEIFEKGGNITSNLYSYANNINNLTVDTEENFTKKMNQGFAEIMQEMLVHDMAEYSADDFFDKLDSVENFDEAIDKIANADSYVAAEYIEDTYTNESARNILKSTMLIIIFLVLMLIVRLIAQKINSSDTIGEIGIAEHPVGAILGIIRCAVGLCIMAVIVRCLVVVGNSEMLFFNEKTIDETIVFKYIYDLKILK